MKCFNHPDIGAVAQCGTCGINTCKECCSDFTINNKIACKKCYEKLNTEIKIDEAKLINDVKFMRKWWKISFIILFMVIVGGALLNVIPNFEVPKLLEPMMYLIAGIIKFVGAIWYFSIFYCIYRVWKYIPGLMSFMPIVGGSGLFIFLVFFFLFAIFFGYWMIYTFIVFPIKYRNYGKTI